MLCVHGLCCAVLCCAVQYLLSADTSYTYNVVLYVLQSTTLWCVLHTAVCWGYVERLGKLQLAGLHVQLTMLPMTPSGFFS